MSYIRTRFIFLVVLLSFFITLSYLWALLVQSYFYENETSPKSTLLDTERIQFKRRSRVAEMCQNLNASYNIKDLPSALLDHVIVDDEHKLLYCFVPKVACTNWKRVLLVLRGVKNNPLSISGNETHMPNQFKMLNQYSPDEMADKLEKYLKFMFVRHPYERLLSAYRNKFETAYSDYFRLHYGTEIIKGYRTDPVQESLSKGHDVKFEEFLEYVVNLNSKNHKILFNEHWRPSFDLCHPCHITYNVLGKYDTLESDAEYVIWRAHIENLVKFPQRDQSYRFVPTAGVMETYYQNVSKAIYNKLFDVYKDDFAFFEYEPQVF